MSDPPFVEVPRSYATERCSSSTFCSGGNHEVESVSQPETKISVAGQSSSLGLPSISLLLELD